jgi:hypothetical protein
MNIDAFTSSRKKTLFCKRLDQNLAFSCSSLLAPWVINRTMIEITPTAIIAYDHS